MEDETTMTIEELAGIVAKGFLEMQKEMQKFADQVELSMREMEARINGRMDKGFKEVHLRIDKVVAVHDDHARRIKKLELKTA